MYNLGITKSKHIKINTRGGILTVKFMPTNYGFEKIILSGDVDLVFKGEFAL